MTQTDRTGSPFQSPDRETGASAGLAAGETSFPIGGVAAVPQPVPVDAQHSEEERSLHRAPVEAVVTQRRQTNRPSTALVIGSAVAGAIAGGVLPFMLAGRKSAANREVLLIEDHSATTRASNPRGKFPVGGRSY